MVAVVVNRAVRDASIHAFCCVVLSPALLEVVTSSRRPCMNRRLTDWLNAESRKYFRGCALAFADDRWWPLSKRAPRDEPMQRDANVV